MPFPQPRFSHRDLSLPLSLSYGIHRPSPSATSPPSASYITNTTDLHHHRPAPTAASFSSPPPSLHSALPLTAFHRRRPRHRRQPLRLLHFLSPPQPWLPLLILAATNVFPHLSVFLPPHRCLFPFHLPPNHAIGLALLRHRRSRPLAIYCCRRPLPLFHQWPPLFSFGTDPQPPASVAEYHHRLLPPKPHDKHPVLVYSAGWERIWEGHGPWVNGPSMGWAGWDKWWAGQLGQV